MKINPHIHNTLTSIAHIYKMAPATLKSLIKHELHQHSSGCKILPPNQVKEIIESLGSPDLLFSEFDPIKYSTNHKLAEYYKVHPRTFYNWIKNINGLKNENKFRRRYTPKEVKIIIEHLGI